MRADRLLSIILLLQKHGQVTAKSLADDLEVSQRTILRDVDALSVAGVPIYAEGGHGGGIALDENYRVTLTGLKESEIRSLFVSNNNQLLKDVGLGDAAESTLLKLFAALPVPHQPSVDYIRQRIHIDPLWWWHDSEPLTFLSELQQAVYEDRSVRVLYQNYSGEVAERVLEPYSLVAKSSFWYLVAKQAGELRIYRVSRFHEITLLDNYFRRDENFDLATYWRDHLEGFKESLSDYAFTLRIHDSRMSFARWLTPGRCEVIDTDGDWVTARFHMESMDLAKMLVFGLGAQAVVIEPPELHDAVLEAARAMLENH